MSLFQFDDFEYTPLPTPTSIRLLRLHRTRGGILPSLCGYPLIQCSLHVVDLSSAQAPTYEALSYTWDSPATEKQKRNRDNWTDEYSTLCKWPVVVRNGSTGAQRLVYVRKNLFDAMRQIQSMNDVDRKVGTFDHTALHDAAIDGDVDRAKDLLSDGASCGARDTFGETPLHCMFALLTCSAPTPPPLISLDSKLCKTRYQPSISRQED